MPGRSIGDNVLLAQELVYQYHLHEGQPKCAMKADLASTYDSVEWNFLLAILQLMNFLPRLCGWIRECVTTLASQSRLMTNYMGFFGEVGA